MLFSVTCYITMLCLCHKPYNDKYNVLLMSNNQCSIVTVACVFAQATGAAQKILRGTRPTTEGVARPHKKCLKAHNWAEENSLSTTTSQDALLKTHGTQRKKTTKTIARIFVHDKQRCFGYRRKSDNVREINAVYERVYFCFSCWFCRPITKS